MGGGTISGGMFGGKSWEEIESALGLDTTKQATAAVEKAVRQAKTGITTSETISRSLPKPIAPILNKFVKDRAHLEKLIKSVKSKSTRQMEGHLRDIEATTSDISRIFDSPVFKRTASNPPQFRISPLSDWEWEQDLEGNEDSEVHVFVLGAMYEFYICAVGTQGEPDQETKAKFEAIERFLAEQGDLIADQVDDDQEDTEGGDQSQTA